MPETVPPAVTRSFAALVPGFIVVTVIWILRLIIENTFGSIHNIVGQILQEPLSVLGASLWGAIIAVILVHVLLVVWNSWCYYCWWCNEPCLVVVNGSKPSCFSSWARCTKYDYGTVFDLWIYMGGSGATLALVVGMLLFARSQQ